MTTRTRIARMAIGAVLAAVAAAPAFAAPGPSTGTSDAYQALRLRSQALNILYGLGKPEGMTDAQYRASLIQSSALNARYGLPVALSPDETARLYASRAVGSTPTQGPLAPTVPATANGFDWTDAMIGAAFAVGVLAVGATAAFTMRRHVHIGHLRPH